jgi:hypothetical protein
VPKTSAYTDQRYAASVPIEISVSIVAVPCRRLAHVARWNGRPAQRTTGVARTSDTHCQPSNCAAGTIDSTITGTPSATATTSRRRQPRVRSGSSGCGMVAE